MWNGGVGERRKVKRQADGDGEGWRPLEDDRKMEEGEEVGRWRSMEGWRGSRGRR